MISIAVEETDDILSNTLWTVDAITEDGEIIIVSGFAVDLNSDSTKNGIQLFLQNKDGLYPIDTITVPRYDLDLYFNTDNHLYG